MTDGDGHFYDAISWRGQCVTYRAQCQAGQWQYIYAWIGGTPRPVTHDLRAAIISDIEEQEATNVA